MPTPQSAIQAFEQSLKQAGIVSGVITTGIVVYKKLTHQAITETFRPDNYKPSPKPETLQEAFADIAKWATSATAVGVVIRGSARALGRPGQPHKLARAIGFASLFAAYDVVRTHPWNLPSRTDGSPRFRDLFDPEI